jgi:NLE (NUC135) domain
LHCSFIYIIADPEHENQPFDFLIDGELIRMPLDQFLMAKGISAVCFTIPTLQFYSSSIVVIWTICILMYDMLLIFGGIAGESA